MSWKPSRMTCSGSMSESRAAVVAVEEHAAARARNSCSRSGVVADAELAQPAGNRVDVLGRGVDEEHA